FSANTIKSHAGAALNDEVIRDHIVRSKVEKWVVSLVLYCTVGGNRLKAERLRKFTDRSTTFFNRGWRDNRAVCDREPSRLDQGRDDGALARCPHLFRFVVT